MSIALDEAIDRFFELGLPARDPSPHTVSAYQRDLAKLSRYCARAGLVRLEQVDARHLRTLLAEQRGAGAAPTSVRRLLASCRALFRHAAGSGYLGHDPSIGVRAPKLGRKLPKVLDVDAVQQLFADSAPGPADFTRLRDLLMLELLYGTGMRLAELAGLDLGDFDLAAGQVRVLGKGRRERLLPLTQAARTALQSYLPARAAAFPQAGMALLLSNRGERLSHRSIQLRCRNLAREQGLAEHLHPHLLRHCFASHVLESSGDIRAVQELLGHRDLSTTQIYTHLDFQHLAKVYDSAHPRAGRRKDSDS